MVNKHIYFDHAATTPVCEEAFNKMKPYFTEVFGNPKEARTREFLSRYLEDKGV